MPSLPFPQLASMVIAATLLSGCAVAPHYARPEVQLRPAYVAAAPVSPADAEWWRGFADPALDSIIARVQAGNLDLAAAAARIAQARAAAGLASANRLPAVSAGATFDSVSQSLNTPFGVASTRFGVPRQYDLTEAGTEASWEIDLFGRLARRSEAARADLAATGLDREALRLSLTAEAADAYLQLRGLQAVLAITEAQRDVLVDLAGLVRQRVAAGRSPSRDLDLATGEREAVEAAIPRLRAAIAGQSDRIDLLMGRPAGEARTEFAIESGGAVPVPAAIMASGSTVPADLLRRRPDIAAAEQRLVAANARIGAAIGEYYPHLSLRALLGVASLGRVSLISGDAVQARGGGALRWNLFDFGRVDAEVAAARGREAEALAQYRAAVLRATGDVETALTGLEESRLEVSARERQVAALTRARDQLRLAYRQGAVALLDVLAAEARLLTASGELAGSRIGAARASVASTRALGGGFERKGADNG